MRKKSMMIYTGAFIVLVGLMCSQSQERPVGTAGKTEKEQKAPSVSSAAQVVKAVQSTFNAPEIEGMRLDWCLHFGRQCGKPAADRYCAAKGLSAAVKWRVEEGIGKTYIIGDKKVCNARYCDGFKFILCR
ncbi:MAG TPA: hypothetical protein PKX12_11240 [Spirochaetota bacterium]|nr:hypothetical protein [Spirochaetota bacterium]